MGASGRSLSRSSTTSSATGAGRSSLIFPNHIAESGCDYVALGHWDSFTNVSQKNIPAYYSGCPTKLSNQKTGMVSIITMDPSDGVSHTRFALKS